jgi:hypothetical protein
VIEKEKYQFLKKIPPVKKRWFPTPSAGCLAALQLMHAGYWGAAAVFQVGA